MLRLIHILFLLGMAGFISCLKEEIPSNRILEMEAIAIPAGFPAISHPPGNDFTKERWLLGKSLFFDPALSVDSTISCASCHKPAQAFAANTPTSPGVKGRPGTRNVPSLANVVYYPYFLKEGGVPTLEMQVLVPVAEHNEFDFNLSKIVERLSSHQQYQAMAQAAYGRPLDAFVVTRSISLFERSLLSGESKYDAFIHGKSRVFNELETEGMALFFNPKTNCNSCHGGFLFTNFAFANNGIHAVYDDEGRFRLTGKQDDLHLFKTPSLRNVGLTAPYMHDGSIATLEDVISHYNAGGKKHWQQSTLVRPLGLTDHEQKALVAFLRTLDDAVFLSNPLFHK
jgi:cytochrome c peroxidase